MTTMPHQPLCSPAPPPCPLELHLSHNKAVVTLARDGAEAQGGGLAGRQGRGGEGKREREREWERAGERERAGGRGRGREGGAYDAEPSTTQTCPRAKSPVNH